MSKIILITGARAVGKSTVASILAKEGFSSLPKYTTRNLRQDENEMVQKDLSGINNDSISYQTNGIHYWISKNELNERLELKEKSITSINDIQTIQKLKEKYKERIVTCLVESNGANSSYYSPTESEHMIPVSWIKQRKLESANQIINEHRGLFDFKIDNNGTVDNLKSQVKLLIEYSNGNKQEEFVQQDSEELKYFVKDLRIANEKIKKYLSIKPENLHSLSSRQFEEFVATILYDIGYEVELTAQTRDGGYDIKAIKSDELGSFLTLVECKKYNPVNPIGVSLIREFYSVTELNKANKGLIFTSSYFSKDAIELTKNFATRIELKDFEKIKELLKRNGQ